MMRRILGSIFTTGLDAPGEPPTVDIEAHCDIALDIAWQDIVLLKNAGILPDALQGTGRIAVIGGYAQLGVVTSQALLAAREAAKKPKRRIGTTLQRDGHGPLGLSAKSLGGVDMGFNREPGAP
ncbi:hypothetical protein [Streptomyces filamentosus]|uniref:hypothetical protein n=1 Tax=Streptomyces filamentosus TaxID=67294 RepID=UPI0037CDC329